MLVRDERSCLIGRKAQQYRFLLAARGQAHREEQEYDRDGSSQGNGRSC